MCLPRPTSIFLLYRFTEGAVYNLLQTIGLGKEKYSDDFGQQYLYSNIMPLEKDTIFSSLVFNKWHYSSLCKGKIQVFLNLAPCCLYFMQFSLCFYIRFSAYYDCYKVIASICNFLHNHWYFTTKVRKTFQSIVSKQLFSTSLCVYKCKIFKNHWYNCCEFMFFLVASICHNTLGILFFPFSFSYICCRR